jgi:hypothetical protein
MKSIQTQAIITGIRSKVDRSLGISLSTPELTIHEKALFMELQGLNIDLVITPNEEKSLGVEKIEKEMETKTPSQRLRAVIFLLWKQDEEKNGDYNTFYKTMMEKFIDHIKGKLEN